MKILLIFFLFINIANAKLLIKDVYKYNSKTISELSALAYDGKTLFALSDYGVLYHFNLEIQNKKIKNISLIKSFKLKNKSGKILKKKKRDSEGLIYKNHHLYISFEGSARIDKYSLDGIKIKKIKIPKILRDIKNYNSKNKALEALTYSKKYGFLTAPESPFEDKKIHKLYTNDKTFNFKSSGYITALEFIDKDTVLVLQRDYELLSREWKITLSKVYLDQCRLNLCKSKILKELKSATSYFADNYEGLTRIKDNLFLMVSDDNNNMFQQTYFVLFEIQ